MSALRKENVMKEKHWTYEDAERAEARQRAAAQAKLVPIRSGFLTRLAVLCVQTMFRPWSGNRRPSTVKRPIQERL